MLVGQKNKEAVVTRVIPGSLAAEVGITPGDYLLAVNGEEMEDLIDYKYLTSDEELLLLVRKPDGEEWEIEIEKDYDEDLGIEFAAATFDDMRSCTNKCVFCFIDQNPDHLRKTLYEYDDDYRLSFLYGQFVTLTNMQERDFERISRLHLSPLYVSVHTMDPDLRATMLRSKRARDIRRQLDFFRDHGISIHTQIVLCPGINDGVQLDYTVRELAAYYPTVLSVAVVPAGITQFREHLPNLQSLDDKGAAALIRQVDTMQEHWVKQIGTRFVWVADEIYIAHDIPLPPEGVYETMPQVENGVGIVRVFQEQFADALAESKDQLHSVKSDRKRPSSIVTGVLGAKVLQPLVDQLRSLGVNVEVHCIKNRFFGESITAAGLITGVDIIQQLAGQPVGDEVLLPDVMLRRHDAQVFLDEVTLEQLQDRLGVPVVVLSGAHELVAHLAR